METKSPTFTLRHFVVLKVCIMKFINKCPVLAHRSIPLPGKVLNVFVSLSSAGSMKPVATGPLLATGFILVYCLAYSSALKMETIFSSET
jgi:hypothetical protein